MAAACGQFFGGWRWRLGAAPELRRRGRGLPSDAPSRAGKLHNLCAIPIFAGIPLAASTCAGSAVIKRDYRWAAYCAGSAAGMAGAFALFGAALGGRPQLAGYGGAFQRISIATGFGWLSTLSLRALRADGLAEPAHRSE